MQIVFHNHFRQCGRAGTFQNTSRHLAGVVFVEIIVVLAMAKGVLGLIKGHSSEGADRTQSNLWRGLQNERVNIGGAG
jgi:hypothetical protein